MEIMVQALPALSEIDEEAAKQLQDLVEAGKLSFEDAENYEGWLVARTIGSEAIIGCVGYEKRENNVYMQSLVVDTELRRNGIGRALTEEIEDRVLRSGDNLLALTLFWNNSFYSELGFERVDAKTVKAQDDVAGRIKNKYCTVWEKTKQ